jgi:membrane-bound ClpP family serine protease
MTNWASIAIFYGVGMALLIAELFLPAHGLIGLAGLGVLAFGIYETYLVNTVAGHAGLIATLIMLPIGLYISVKTWHRTPIGRRISPPNPVLTEKDRLPVEDLRRCLGKVGRTITLCRPVGMCVFDGRRVECTSEQGVIEAGVDVKAIRLVDRTLSIRPTAVPQPAPAGDEQSTV